MGRYLRLYWMFVQLNIRAKLEYRAEFWFTLLGRLLEIAMAFVFFWATLRHIGHVGNWSLWQLGLILAVTSLVRALAELLFTNVWFLADKIRTGSLDSLLVRPIDPLFHLVAERVEIQGVGLLASGVAILAWCLAELHLHLSVWALLAFTIIILCGGLLYLFLLLLFATICFWLVGADTYPMAIVVSFNEFARYPLPFFPAALRITFTWLLPFAFTGYYPALFLTGGSGDATLALAVVPVTALFAVVSYAFWRLGLRHYQSTGV